MEGIKTMKLFDEENIAFGPVPSRRARILNPSISFDLFVSPIRYFF